MEKPSFQNCSNNLKWSSLFNSIPANMTPISSFSEYTKVMQVFCNHDVYFISIYVTAWRKSIWKMKKQNLINKN